MQLDLTLWQVGRLHQRMFDGGPACFADVKEVHDHDPVLKN
jgi:hypothetical protein